MGVEGGLGGFRRSLFGVVGGEEGLGVVKDIGRDDLARDEGCEQVEVCKEGGKDQPAIDEAARVTLLDKVLTLRHVAAHAEHRALGRSAPRLAARCDHLAHLHFRTSCTGKLAESLSRVGGH